MVHRVIYASRLDKDLDGYAFDNFTTELSPGARISSYIVHSQFSQQQKHLSVRHGIIPFYNKD